MPSLPTRRRMRCCKEQIRGLRALQAAGAEVLLLQADVTDAAQVQAAWRRQGRHSAAFDGLVHCAGYGEFVPVRETSREVIEAVLAPKVRGTAEPAGGAGRRRARAGAAVLVDVGRHHRLRPGRLCRRLRLAGCAGAVAQASGAGKTPEPRTRFVVDRLGRLEHAAANRARAGRRRLAAAPAGKQDRHPAARRRGSDPPGAGLRPAAGGHFHRRFPAIAAQEPQRWPSALQHDDGADDSHGERRSGGQPDAVRAPQPVDANTWRHRRPRKSCWPRSGRKRSAFAKIGVNDNFFELGGESLLGVKIVVKAKKMGLLVDPKQMFATPTIAQIAQSLQKSTNTFVEQGPVEGDAPCTPVQGQFLDAAWADADHWNVGLLVDVARARRRRALAGDRRCPVSVITMSCARTLSAPANPGWAAIENGDRCIRLRKRGTRRSTSTCRRSTVARRHPPSRNIAGACSRRLRVEGGPVCTPGLLPHRGRRRETGDPGAPSRARCAVARYRGRRPHGDGRRPMPAPT